MEKDGSLHLPDFSLPDFMQPPLEQVDLTIPGFVMPDPLRSPHDWPLGPLMERPATDGPDPALPDLLALERPVALEYTAEDAPVLARAEYTPEVVMQERPGELDPTARTMLPGSPDGASLPADLAYPQLYTDDAEMTRRKRHFALLEPGLAEGARDDHAR